MVAVRDQKGGSELQKEEEKSGSDLPRNHGEESRNDTCVEPGVVRSDEPDVRSTPNVLEKSVIEVLPVQPQVVAEEPVTPPEEVEDQARESERPLVHLEESSENQSLSPKGSSAFPANSESMPEMSTHSESVSKTSAHSESMPETSTHSESMPDKQETSTHSESITELSTHAESISKNPTLPLENAAIHIDLSQEGVEPKTSPLTLEERMEQVLDAMEHQIASSESVHSAFKPPHIIPQPVQSSNTPSLPITHIQFIYINHRGCAVGALSRSHG